MIFIGVTGGIGSGKTTVCKLFSKGGIDVFQADEVAKNISDTDISVKKEIIKRFGASSYTASGILDRKKISSIVFTDNEKLFVLNSILHPVVFDHFKKWKIGLKSKNSFALAEAALMFETGMDELVDYTLSVIAENQERISRVIQRDHTTEDQVLSRLQQQLPQEIIKKESDFIIVNNSDIPSLQRQVQFFNIIFSNLKHRVIEL
jgi:dephospho-CoA kinase